MATEEERLPMYICHCEAVTDTSIRSAIDAGARTLDEVSAHCRAGTGCGGCWPALFALLERELDRGFGLDDRPVEVASAR